MPACASPRMRVPAPTRPDARNRPHPNVRGLGAARLLRLSRLLAPRYAFATTGIARSRGHASPQRGRRRSTLRKQRGEPEGGGLVPAIGEDRAFEEADPDDSFRAPARPGSRHSFGDISITPVVASWHELRDCYRVGRGAGRAIAMPRSRSRRPSRRCDCFAPQVVARRPSDWRQRGSPDIRAPASKSMGRDGQRSADQAVPSGNSVHERRHRSPDVDGPERPEAKRLSVTELLTEGVGNASSLELLLMMLGAFIARRALEGGVQPVAAVVDGPNRELVRDGACFHR